MRAGLGGTVTWVARIGQDRRPICNEVSMAAAKARLAAPEAASQTMPQAVALEQTPMKPVGKPMSTVASNMRAQNQIGVQAPMVVPGLTSGQAFKVGSVTNSAATVASVVAPTLKAQTVARSARCPAEAPVMQQMALRSGGTVLVCTRGDGGQTGWVSPGYPAGVGGTIQNPPGQAVAYSGNMRPKPATAPVQTVIAGVAISPADQAQTQYVAAWKDDRLNPLRGMGTAEGWAMQDQIWTKKAPAKLVKNTAPKADSTLRVTQSTMTSAQPVAQGARYVQVGTFGNPANVASVAGALSAMGLPVSKSHMSKAGRDLVIVFAGPFNSAQAAQSALGMARQAGFGDAFLR